MKKEIVDALIESMSDPNAGWEYNEYTATNDRIKCQIWLGNGLEFVEVEFWGGKIGPHASRREPIKYGGGNMLGFLVPWRWRIYLAATSKQSAALRKEEVKPATIVAAIKSASLEAA